MEIWCWRTGAPRCRERQTTTQRVEVVRLWHAQVAHGAIFAVGLSVAVGSTRPILENMPPGVLKVHLTFSGGMEESFPECPVRDCHNTTDRLVSAHLLDLEWLDWGGDVVFGDVVWRRLRRVIVRYARGKTRPLRENSPCHRSHEVWRTACRATPRRGV